MKVITRIGPVFQDEIGKGLFNRLLSIYPEGRTGNVGHGFKLRLPQEDPRVGAIRDAFESAGLVPWTDRQQPDDDSKSYVLQCLRLYDDSDMRDLPYLELNPPTEAHFHDTPRREDGLIRVLQGYLNDAVDVGFTEDTWYIVPNRVKRLLEGSGLAGLQFRPTLLMEGTYADAKAQPIPWDRYGEPWWELESDCTMPPLSASMTFTDSDGNVLKRRDFSNGFLRSEGLYIYPELHYRASALANLPKLDLARTAEPFGNGRGYDRLECPLVASNRFYKFFVDHDLKTGWIPVRIDPD